MRFQFWFAIGFGVYNVYDTNLYNGDIKYIKMLKSYSQMQLL